MPDQTRPSKKQHELLVYIEKFIAEHGYSPSYREIMKGSEYSSVATVALHVNNLIAKGHLNKKDRSARSIEVVKKSLADTEKIATNQIRPSEEKWLVGIIEYKFKQLESVTSPNKNDIDGLYVLVGALKVLGFDGASQSFMPRLSALKQSNN